MDRTVCHVGIGANLGDARRSVEQALTRLAQLPQTRVTARSDLFSSAPLDADGDDYMNAVVQLDTELDAEALLRGLQAVEQEFGRERPYPNAPRTLDLDLLLFGDAVIASDTITVPHPRMTQRAFVLIPLLQIDPLIAIPGLGPAHAFVPAVAGQVIRRI